MGTLLGCIGVGLLALTYALAIRPRLRQWRLRPVADDTARIRDAVTFGLRLTPHQERIALKVSALRHAEDSAARAESRAKGLVVPVPVEAAPGERPEDTLGRLAHLLDDKAVVLTAAGGEQLFRSLLDMARPGALQHLSDALGTLYESGWIDFARNFAHSGLSDAVAQHAADLLAHGASLADLARAPGDMAQAAHDAAHHVGDALDPTDAAGFHFPWAAVVLSTVREGALLLDDKTSVERALKHVALDTGATAVGVFGGAKAGALVGAFFGPAGAGLGAVLGGIAGAVGGRHVAREVKAGPLRSAVSAYGEAFARMETETSASVSLANRNVATAAKNQRDRYQASISQHPRLGPERLYVLDAPIARVVEALREESRQLQARVEQMASLALASVPRARWLHRILGLDVTAAARHEISRTQSWAAHGFADQVERLASLAGAGDNIATLSRLVALRLPSSPTLLEQLSALDAALGSVLHAFLEEVGRWTGATVAKYSEAVAQVAIQLNAEGQRHKGVFDEWRRRLAGLKEEIDRHRLALGMQ